MTGVVQRLRWLGLILLSFTWLTIGHAEALEKYDFDAQVPAANSADDLVTVFRVEGTPNARLTIDAAGNVSTSRSSTVWLNFGDDVRAGNYLTQKLDAGLPGVQVKGFQVPRSYLDDLTSRLVPERGSRAFPNSPIQSLDGPGQIGLRPSLLDELEANIVPGSGFSIGGFR